VSTNFGQPIAGLGLGTKVADYRLDGQIGRGGMAVVYRATDERLDRRVALKVLVPELARDHAFRQRFIRESRAAAAVDHPNIIPIYDAGDAAGVLFIAMRYVQGGDVRQLLERTGSLSAARAWSIITQVALALDTIHAHGLIHRDVKPANMLLDAGSVMPGAAPQPIAGDHLEHVTCPTSGSASTRSPPASPRLASSSGLLTTSRRSRSRGEALTGARTCMHSRARPSRCCAERRRSGEIGAWR